MKIILKNKRGNLLTEESLKLILGVAVAFVLIVLMWQLIAPQFDRKAETAESYVESFKELVVNLEEGETDTFTLWDGSGEEGIYLVYLGKSVVVDVEGKEGLTFSSLGSDENKLCGCYAENVGWVNKEWKSECLYCEGFDEPLKFYDVEGKWVAYPGDNLIIEDIGGGYNVRKG